MEALLIQTDIGGWPDYCLIFPDAGIISTSGRDGQVFGIGDKAAEFWFTQKQVGKVDVPFDVVARLYCYYRDYRLAEFKKSDSELWDDSRIKAAVSEASKDYYKKQTSAQSS